MFDTKSDYALNKRGKSAIVCSSATGAHIRLTREDFASEEAFKRWKSWSDQDTVSPFVVALRSEIKSPQHCQSDVPDGKGKGPGLEDFHFQRSPAIFFPTVRPPRMCRSCWDTRMSTRP